MARDEGSRPQWRTPKGRRPGARAKDTVFAGVVVGFAHAVRRLMFGPPPDEPDDGGLAGSRVPRRPPDHFGSGSVALVEPDADSDDHSH